jgi:diguanylate cyclase (GGDEF)-like protein/PAS domain S-box-containing protein
VEQKSKSVILLVDDSESDRSTYRHWLTRGKFGQETYQIVEFATGEEALTWCQKQLPDIFMIDYLLPDMTGLDFLCQLKEEFGLEKVPAIILTSQGNTLIAIQLIKNGAEDYLDKNQLTDETLRRSISAVFKQFQLFNQLQAAEIEGEKSRFFRKILDNLSTFVMVLTPDGILLEVNQPSLRLSGLKREDVIGKNIEKIYWWQYSSTASTTIRNAVNQAGQGKKVRFDMPIQIVAGELIDVDLFFNPLYDSRGRVINIIISGTDISDRKQTEIALQKSESTKRVILETMPDLLLRLNRDGTCLNHIEPRVDNQDFLPITLHISEVLPPDLLEKQLQVIETAIATGELQVYEHQFLKNGLINYEEIRILALNEQEVLVIVRNISDRKQAEITLKQSEMTNRVMLATMPDLLIQMDRQGNYIRKSGGSDVRVIEPEKVLIKLQIHDILPPYLAEQQLYYANLALDTHQLQVYEQVVDCDDERRYEEVRVAPVNDDEVLMIIRDVTDRKRAEIALHKQALVFENISDGVIITDMKGDIIDWNKGAERLYGYTKAEVLGKKPSMLHSTEEGIKLEKEIISETIRTGSWSGELPITRKDGVERITETFTVILRDQEGKAIALVGVNRDISDRKESEKMIRQQIQQEQLLFSVSQAIRQSLDLQEILATTTREVKDILQVDRVTVYRFNPDWSGNFIMESVDKNWKKLVGTGTSIAWKDTYLQENQDGRSHYHQSYVVSDIYHLDLQPCQIEILETFQTKAYVTSPIFTGDSLWGLLGIYHNTMPRHWQPWEIELLEQIATQLAIAIYQSELYEKLQKELQERKKIEVDLQQSKEQFELVIQASNDGFWDWDFITNEIYYSPRWKEMLGYEDHELPNTLETWRSLISPEDYAIANQLIQDYLTGKIDHFSMTKHFTHKDGSTVYIMSRGIYLKDDQGQVIRMIGSHSDITEIMKIQNELETSKQSLQLATEQLKIRVDELKQRNTEMLILSEINDFLQSCITVEEACRTVATFIQPLFPDSSGEISVINNSRNYLEKVACWGKNCDLDDFFESNDCWALRRGKVHHVTEHCQKLLCNHIQLEQAPTESLCIPLIAQGETLGLFSLSVFKVDQLGERQKQLAVTISEQMSSAIANLMLREKLEFQSIRDPLTGLFNRRYLEEFLNKEIHRATRNRYSIGVIMIDLDHFRNINNTWGHPAGDFALKEIANLLKNMIRSSDVACRYGGEEMTLVLPESPLDATAKKAEEIRVAIAQLQLNYNDEQLIKVTSSFGVACFPDQGKTVKEIIQAADIALFQAKANGRNQVVVSFE